MYRMSEIRAQSHRREQIPAVQIKAQQPKGRIERCDNVCEQRQQSPHQVCATPAHQPKYGCTRDGDA
jgi:hypothetical protein